MIKVVNANENLYLEGTPGKFVYLIYQGELVLEKNMNQYSFMPHDVNGFNRKNSCMMKLVSGAFAGMEAFLSPDSNYEYTLRTLSMFNVLFRININDLHEFRGELIGFMKQLHDRQRLIIDNIIIQKNFIKKSYDKLFKTENKSKHPYRKIYKNIEEVSSEYHMNSNFIRLGRMIPKPEFDNTFSKPSIVADEHNKHDSSYFNNNFSFINKNTQSFENKGAIFSESKLNLDFSSPSRNKNNRINIKEKALSFNNGTNQTLSSDTCSYKTTMKQTTEKNYFSDSKFIMEQNNSASSKTLDGFPNDKITSAFQMYTPEVVKIEASNVICQSNILANRFVYSFNFLNPVKIYEKSSNNLNDDNRKIYNFNTKFLRKNSIKSDDSSNFFTKCGSFKSLQNGSTQILFKKNDQLDSMCKETSLRIERSEKKYDFSVNNKIIKREKDRSKIKIIDLFTNDEKTTENKEINKSRILLKTPVKRCILDWKNSQGNKSHKNLYKTNYFNLPLISSLK